MTLHARSDPPANGLFPSSETFALELGNGRKGAIFPIRWSPGVATGQRRWPSFRGTRSNHPKPSFEILTLSQAPSVRAAVNDQMHPIWRLIALGRGSLFLFRFLENLKSRPRWDRSRRLSHKSVSARFRCRSGVRKNLLALIQPRDSQAPDCPFSGSRPKRRSAWR